MRFRTDLYRSARALGTASAASKGPEALGKRLARKKVYRTVNHHVGRALRKWGLG